MHFDGSHLGSSSRSPLREKEVSNFNDCDCKPIGGDDVSSSSPRVLNCISTACLLHAASNKAGRSESHDASRRQSSCHALKGNFSGEILSGF